MKEVWDPADDDDTGLRRPAQAAVEAAIRSLATTALKPRTDSMLRAFLAFKAVHHGGAVQTPTGQDVERVVKERFTIVPTPPGASDDMLAGTIGLRGVDGKPSWLSNESYRGSFLDYVGPTSPGRFMFEGENWRNPMREDAVQRVVETLGSGRYGWPRAEALAAIALRNDSLDPQLGWSELEGIARERFGVDEAEWAAVTSSAPLEIGPFDGPEWDPAQLTAELKPSGAEHAARSERQIEDLPDRLAEEVKRVVDALSSHGRNAIVALVGVPGTSKSHVARIAARTFASVGCLTEIQFSPSYTYEEFMEGPRYGEEMRAEVMQGAFLELNWRALTDPGNQYVMLIEEFTRADLPRVLGELLTFVEYRDETDVFTTLYTRDATSRIAPNLAILATYNPTDRSAVNVDAALIRRMRILDFPPDMVLLREILDENGMDSQVTDRLVALFDACRDVAGDRFEENMPFGHAVFASVGSETDLYDLWHQTIKHMLVRPHAPRHELYPTIEQHYPWRGGREYTVVSSPGSSQDAGDIQDQQDVDPSEATDLEIEGGA